MLGPAKAASVSRSSVRKSGPRRGVDRGQWLVEQEQLGLARERSGERHALLFAAGQVRRPRRRVDAGREVREEPIRARAGRRRPFAARTRRERDVLACAHPWEQHAVLEGETDPASTRIERVDPTVAQLDAAVFERDESGERFEHRGLSRTVAPDERDGLPVGDVQLDIDEVRTATDPHGCMQTHQRAPMIRSRSATSTAIDTTTSTSESATAPSRSVCSC